MSTQTPALNGYGYVSDNDESLGSKTGGKFGLNAGNCFLTKFAYNPNVAKAGEPVREAIEIVVQIGDRKYMDWISPITQVYVKKVKIMAPFTDPAAIEEYNAQLTQQGAIVTHYLKAVGGNEEALKASLSASPILTFADYATRVCALFPTGFQNIPLDVFLEYQWEFGKKEDGSFNDKTYATLPKNMKGGHFIVKAQPGTWTEDREGGALKYKNATGAEHPLFKTKDFMESKKGYQQIEGQEGPANAAGNTAFAPTPGAAQTSTWDAPGAGNPA